MVELPPVPFVVEPAAEAPAAPPVEALLPAVPAEPLGFAAVAE